MFYKWQEQINQQGDNTFLGPGRKSIGQQDEVTRLLRKRFVATTRSKHRDCIAPNHLNRNFSVNKPNRVWVIDVTFITT